MILLRISFFLFILFSIPAHSQVTFEESRAASVVIAKWISRSTAHFDFLSATPVAPKRAGDKFMITIYPAKQYASDYGFSYQQIKRDQNITSAYRVLGFNTDEFAKTVNLTRFHLNWGLTNDYDFTFSYLKTNDDISGWGVGVKQLLIKYRYFYLSHRIQLGRSELNSYFDNWALVNDLSMSLYFTLIDIYTGVRHSAGRVNFYSSTSQLNLPRIDYFSKLSELEFYYGVVLATSTNTRLTFQGNKNGEELSIGAKFSFHFDSLLPTFNSDWFRDPRYIKQ